MRDFRLSTPTPILEDSTAIFREVCRHETVLKTELGYEGERVITESIDCEESRSLQFEPQTIEILSTDSAIDVPEDQDA